MPEGTNTQGPAREPGVGAPAEAKRKEKGGGGAENMSLNEAENIQGEPVTG